MPEINYVRLARRWAWMVMLLVLIAVVTAAAVSYELPRLYQTTTVALVNPKQVPFANTGPGGNAVGSSFTPDQLVPTYVRLLQAGPVAGKLVTLGVPRTEGALAGEITAKPETGTSLIDITVTDRDPAIVLAVAQNVIPAFNSALAELQSRVAGDATTPRLDALVAWQVPTAAPTVPVSPRPLTNIGLAAIAGLALGIALAALLEFFDRTLKTEYDVRLRLGLTLLGPVLFKGRKAGFIGNREAVALVTVTHPKDPVSEAYRAIRTNLLFNALDRKLRTILVTSAIPGEGKTSTACNLAVTMAQAGNRVILVDADFRRPELHRVFHRDRNVGLGNLILGDLDDNAAIGNTEVPNLRLLCSGPTPPNPSELLGSRQMQQVIDRLTGMCDIVVFDTPPVGAVTDATVLATRTDGVVLVIERGRTPMKAVEHAREKLQAVGATLLGVVLNKVRSSEAAEYYYYRYYGESTGSNGKTADVAPKGRPAAAAPPVKPSHAAAMAAGSTQLAALETAVPPATRSNGADAPPSTVHATAPADALPGFLSPAVTRPTGSVTVPATASPAIAEPAIPQAVISAAPGPPPAAPNRDDDAVPLGFEEPVAPAPAPAAPPSQAAPIPTPPPPPVSPADGAAPTPATHRPEWETLRRELGRPAPSRPTAEDGDTGAPPREVSPGWLERLRNNED
jgi:non-specific protein-tyrosine kinase